MTNKWSLLLLPCLAALGACGQSRASQVVDAAAAYPARLPIEAGALVADAAPVQPADAAWSGTDGSASFAAPTGAPLLSVTCEHGEAGTAWVRIARHVRGEAGAKALFAMQGNGRIARIKLNVVRSGPDGEWQGLLHADDERLDVLKGGNRIEATLPGGGTLLMPASAAPGALIAACRA